MKHKIGNVLRNLLLTVLLFSLTVMPVNAETESPDLVAADYQVGMESLASVSEEEWLNSVNIATFETKNYDGGFVEAGNSNQTEQELLNLYNIQEDDTSAAFMKGFSMIGNPITEAAIGEELAETDNELTEEALYDMESVSGGDIQVLSAPTAGLQPYIVDEDTLRDGMITTETEIIWLFTGDADIYYYGGFQTGYITQRGSDGFATKFYTPGTYNVLCYGENEAGETSELAGFTVTVVSEFECQTIEDSVNSATDSKSYSVDIDFTNINTAAVCIVRTGKSDVQFKVTDESGNEVQPSPTIYAIPKRWVYIDKPSTDAGICHYTITVSATSYKDNSGSFRVIVGNKDDAEAMMGGLENAVDLDVFRDSQNNYISSTYSPSNDEYWFITSMPYPTVFTLLSNNSHLRYKLLDMDTLEVLFDSNDDAWENMHSTRFTGSYSYAEKVSMQALTGTRRYVVIYNNSPAIVSGVVEKDFRFGAGQPMYGLTHQTVYGSSVTVNSSSYSSTTLNTNTSSFANTAVMNQAYISGVSLTKLDRWRLLAPSASYYSTSSIGSTYITYNFTPGGSFNTVAKGVWDLGIKYKSGNSAASCYPSVNFSFYYEYGDNTITIVPAE